MSIRSKLHSRSHRQNDPDEKSCSLVPIERQSDGQEPTPNGNQPFFLWLGCGAPRRKLKPEKQFVDRLVSIGGGCNFKTC